MPDVTCVQCGECLFAEVDVRVVALVVPRAVRERRHEQQERGAGQAGRHESIIRPVSSGRLVYAGDGPPVVIAGPPVPLPQTFAVLCDALIERYSNPSENNGPMRHALACAPDTITLNDALAGNVGVPG